MKVSVVLICKNLVSWDKVWDLIASVVFFSLGFTVPSFCILPSFYLVCSLLLLSFTNSSKKEKEGLFG